MGLKVVSTKLSDEEYQALLKKVKEEGVSVSDFVRKAVLAFLNLPVSSQPEVNDRLFALEKRVGEIERDLHELKKLISGAKPATSNTPAQAQATEQSSKPKKTAWDVLKEQEIVCTSTMMKAKDPHKILDILKDNGAIVLSSENDRCAVHPDTWMSFVESLSKISSPDEREVLGKLKGKAKQLFKMLRAVGALHFNGKSKTWVVDTSVIEKGEKAPGLKEVKEGEEKAGSQYVIRIPIEEVEDIERFIAEMEKKGWVCNEANKYVICTWREILEQVILDLNNSKASMKDMEKVLAEDKVKLEVAKAAYEAGLLWYDNREKRWRAPL